MPLGDFASARLPLIRLVGIAMPLRGSARLHPAAGADQPIKSSPIPPRWLLGAARVRQARQDPDIRPHSGMIVSQHTPEAEDHGANNRATEMEWDEALVGAWGGETSPQPTAYYRRKAARARQIAEG
jgi:hypothetical protein